MPQQVFINLPVRDLEKTKEFFTKLGFTFNPRFTDDTAACLIINEKAGFYAMLMTHESMRRFTTKAIADAHTTTETINAFSFESKEVVDAMFERAIAAGGKETRPTEDYGWMYGRAFDDLDGHQWEFFYMDISKMPANPAAAV